MFVDLLYDVGNVVLGLEIWKKLVVEVMVNVFGQYYFIEVWCNGVKVKFKNRLIEYGMMCDVYQVVLIFMLLLVELQLLSGQIYIFLMFDFFYYVDMYYDQVSDIMMLELLCEKCWIQVYIFVFGEEILCFVQLLDKEDVLLEDMDLGKQFV